MQVLSCLALCLALILVGFWEIILSEDLIRSSVERLLKDAPLSVTVEGLKKTGFYRISMDGVEFRNKEKEMLHVKQLTAYVAFCDLSKLKFGVSFTGFVGDGTIGGNISFRHSKTHMETHLEKVPVSAVAASQELGLANAGTVSGEIVMNGYDGTGRFKLEDIQFSPRILGTSFTLLPVDIFTSATGKFTVQKNIVHLASVSFEGKDVRARMKGQITPGKINGIIEIMAERSFFDSYPQMSCVLNPFQVAPLYYRIPLQP